MEIALLEDNAIRLKGKQGSVVFEPKKKTKTTADAIIYFAKDPKVDISSDLSSSSRVTISGPGEYEVSGIKISGKDYQGELLYIVNLDYIDIMVATSSAIEKANGKQKEAQVVICDCNSEVNSASILTLSPRITVLYGVLSDTTLKSLGKEPIAKVAKFNTAADKFPAEMEVVLLG